MICILVRQKETETTIHKISENRMELEEWIKENCQYFITPTGIDHLILKGGIGHDELYNLFCFEELQSLNLHAYPSPPRASSEYSDIVSSKKKPENKINWAAIANANATAPVTNARSGWEVDSDPSPIEISKKVVSSFLEETEKKAYKSPYQHPKDVEQTEENTSKTGKVPYLHVDPPIKPVSVNNNSIINDVKTIVEGGYYSNSVGTYHGTISYGKPKYKTKKRDAIEKEEKDQEGQF